ncbi:hypothetical protein ACFSQU_08375 [Massilia sp. GCM10020059]|uniref:Uncharacterized protein n=1 Tax=Massilia agrisoli TaxID=2892444 RepID=A0ABS8IXP1_9BURK|nr:hypothetical protein [Massilia agrisoli]MCC6072448.1 hypothetical protein [Massilia agrisoli]
MRAHTVSASALLRFLAAATVVAGALSAPAHAQTTAKSAATLDVCENAATGKWVYSGVVSLAGASVRGSVARVEYMVQNRVYGTDYKTSYRSAALPLASNGAPVYGFSIEAPALTLGTMRGAATVQLVDPANPARISTFEVVAPEAVCGCEPVKGCVRTQGYWGNKPGVTWPAPYSRTALFFSSGLTLQQVLDAPVQGSGYLILAKQYIAAVLNYASGASAPPSVIDAINQASAFFSGGTTPASCGPGECEEQIALAAILDAYNNGVYPGAPGPCPE